MNANEGNGADILRLSIPSVMPAISVDPESRRLILKFQTVADVAGGQMGGDIELPMAAADALRLCVGVLDALIAVEKP